MGKRASDKRVREELLALQKASRDRMLHPEKIVRWAAAHKTSALYSRFEWDNAAAAHEYRLQQARSLIKLTIIDESGEPEMVSLSVDRTRGGGYRFVADVVEDRDLSSVMLQDALRDLERMQFRYERVRELTGVWNAVDAVRKRAAKKNRRPPPKRRGGVEARV